MLEGIFLVRDSIYFSYLFILLVKIIRGFINVRIEYVDFSFRLDFNCLFRLRILVFLDVVSFVQYYVVFCVVDIRSDSIEFVFISVLFIFKEDVFGDLTLFVFAVIVVYLKLVQFFVRRSSVRSLQYLCRFVINRLVVDVDCLLLFRRMVDYFRQYFFQF